MWAPLPLQYRVYKFSMAGTLEGLKDLPSARNLWVKPYALGDALTGSRYDESVTTGDVGLDVKWGLTPRMTLDLTVNTDFSQVEVDREQVNLSRFSLFFPEKRDFFLENEGTFGFQDIAIRNYRTGSSGRQFRLFHSRQIGLSPTREPLPIGGGARLTGRIGDRLEVGFLDMQTRSLETGGIDPSGFNRSYGVDANVQLTQNLLVSSYWARTDDSDPVGDDANIAMFQAAYRNAFWNISGLYKQVGDGFSPETGFIDRTAVRRYFATVGVHAQVSTLGLREINPYVDFDTYTNLSGAIETRSVEAGTVFSLNQGGQVTFTVADRSERLFEDTRIAGVTVQEGTYDWVEPAVRIATPGNYAVSVSGSVRWGDFYDGTRKTISGDLTFRPTAHLSFDVGAQHNDLNLGGSAFTADLFSGRVRYAHNTRTFFMAFVQYNEAAEELIANARFNLVHSPLSDVFLVYTERRSLADGVTDTVLERGITLKITKLLAF